MTNAILPGRFMPLHSGHEYLINKARAQCDRLTVLVCSHEKDTIPGWQRYAWVKNTFPDLDVRHLDVGYPFAGEQIKRSLPEGASLLPEGGTKFRNLAQVLGLQHVVIDRERKTAAISSSQILEQPLVFWEHLSEKVRPYFIRRVALVGPESCGKSYLARLLAGHFQTAFVEEYGRAYCEKFGMNLTELDFAHIAGGQLYREDETAMQANRILFCDTDLIVTQIWSEIYFNGICQPWIVWADHLRKYDLYLLLAPDIPWINDGLREYEQQREWMFERLKQEMESRALPFVIIRGNYEERTKSAVLAVQKLITV